jgi:hypothetical protein
MSTLLNKEDSKRVADEIIAALREGVFDLNGAMKTVLREELGGIADKISSEVNSALYCAITCDNGKNLADEIVIKFDNALTMDDGGTLAEAIVEAQKNNK